MRVTRGRRLRPARQLIITVTMVTRRDVGNVGRVNARRKGLISGRRVGVARSVAPRLLRLLL